MLIRLSLKIEDIDIDNAEFVLKSTGEPDKTECTWDKANKEPTGPDYSLKIKSYYEDGKLCAEILKKGGKIKSSDDEITDLFLGAYLNLTFKRETDEADGIEHEHEELSEEHEIDTDPYDPKRIRVDTKTFSIRYVMDMIESEDLDLSPDFQREFVWCDITRKSRLIESLLLRIPLPVFYLAQDEDGRFNVVDGVQRLTVIRDFIDNKFKLKNLEYLRDCEGCWFKNKNRAAQYSLDQVYVRRIEQTQLYFNIIDPTTPEKVKYDIFRRINTGGKSLNRQEIRNCLEKPRVRQFIKKLSHSDEFKTATRHSIRSTRMADDEMVLRFIAFYLMDCRLGNQSDYKGDMDTYLDKTVNLMTKLSDKEFDRIERDFNLAMNNAHTLFGDRAFRKSNFINKSLFLSLSRLLYRIDPKKNIRSQHAVISKKLKDEIDNNAAYSQALSMATNDVRHVKMTYNIAKKLLGGLLKNE